MTQTRKKYSRGPIDLRTPIRSSGRTRALMALVTTLTALVACGGAEETPAEETGATEVAASTAMTSASAMGAAGGFDPNAPEYQGDHSLPGDAAAGEEVYRTSCLACHAADGKGNGGITGANLVDDRRRLAKNNDTLLHSIREGILTTSPAMPPHKDILTDTQIRDALSYVRATFGPAPE